MRILGVAGSLRKVSLNRAVLEATAELCPPGLALQVFDGLASLPHFNPDLDQAVAPEPVVAFRRLILSADALLLCTPEYAFGVPGSLKNALDWLVSSGELYEKPTALISAGPGGAPHARAALELTLRAQGARCTEQTTLTLARPGKQFESTSLLADSTIAHDLTRVLLALRELHAAATRAS